LAGETRRVLSANRQLVLLSKIPVRDFALDGADYLNTFQKTCQLFKKMLKKLFTYSKNLSGLSGYFSKNFSPDQNYVHLFTFSGQKSSQLVEKIVEFVNCSAQTP
jgi:hypothetical protein